MPTPTARRSPGLSLFLGALVICGLVAQARPAHAADPDPAVLDNIVNLNRKALDEYQNLNFDEARKLLKNALDAAKDAGLDSHPATARTYVHLGVVVFAGFKQKDEAIKLFRKAVEIQPDIKLDRSLATPEIQEVFDAAAATRAPEAAKPAEADGITHEPITRSPQGRPIAVRAEVAASVGAKKVVLSYNADGGDDFAEREMKEEPPGSGVYTAEIPASATQGAVLEYYIEAVDDEGKTLASKGSPEKAMRVALGGVGAPPVATTTKRKNKETPESGEDQAGRAVAGRDRARQRFRLGVRVRRGQLPEQGLAGWFRPLDAGTVDAGGWLLPQPVPPALAAASAAIRHRRDRLLPGEPSACGGDGKCSPGLECASPRLARASYFLGNGDFRPYVAGMAGRGPDPARREVRHPHDVRAQWERDLRRHRARPVRSSWAAAAVSSTHCRLDSISRWARTRCSGSPTSPSTSTSTPAWPSRSERARAPPGGGPSAPFVFRYVFSGSQSGSGSP